MGIISVPGQTVSGKFVPDFPVEINRSTAIGRAVTFAFTGSTKTDLVSRLLPSINNTSPAIAKNGRAITTAASQTNIQWDRPAADYDFTIIVYANPASTAGSIAMFSQKNDALGAPYDQVGLYANTGSGFAASAGSLAVCMYTGAVYGVQSAVATVCDGNYHQFIATRANATGNFALYSDGAALALTGQTPIINTIYRAGQKVALGNDGNATGRSGVLNIAYAFALKIALTPTQVAGLTLDQLLRPAQRSLFISLGSGNNLSGTSGVQQSASAGLSIAIPMTAASVQIQSGSSAVNVGIPLAGTSIEQQAGAAGLSVSTANALAGIATAVQQASGNLAISIPLSGAMITQAIASGTLALGNLLSGAGQQTQAGSGALSISVTLSGVAVQQAYGSAGLTNTPAGGVALIGMAQQAQSAVGTLSLGNSLSGASLAVSNASGSLTTLVPLSGVSIEAQRATGGMTVGVALSGIALQQALAQAGLTIGPAGVVLSGTSGAEQGASATITMRINLTAASVQTAINSGYLTSQGSLTAHPTKWRVLAVGRKWTAAANARKWRVAA